MVLSTSTSIFAILDRQRAVFETVLSNSSPVYHQQANFNHWTIEWKVLVCDTEASTIIDSLFSSSELRSFGVTLNTIIDSPRGPISGAPALYLVAASPRNVAWITKDLAPRSALYQHSSVAFLTAVSPSLLSALAAQLPIPSPLTSVKDLHTRFISLEQNLFSLNINNSYARLRYSEQNEAELQSIIEQIVDGLFSVLITLGVIPIIRAQRGGPAQAVASILDGRIRDNIQLFRRVTLASKAFSFRRPLLLLVDRDLDFNPIFYHTWTYQALIHDCLDMQLNRVKVNVTSSEKGSSESKTYTLSKKDDTFWDANASLPFPVVAEAVETALTNYREDIESINKRSIEPSDDADRRDGSAEATRLAQAISSLPELTRQKETIDKHTNIATMLLNNINSRSLDTFYELETQLLSELLRPMASQSPDAYKAAITRLLRGGIDDEDAETSKKGSAADRMRMFLIYYDVFGHRFSASDVSEYKKLLKAAGADVSVIDYFAKLKRYQHEKLAPPSPSNGSLNTATLTRLMNRMVHRGYRSITKVAQSAKNLVRDQLTSFVVARTLEIFMKQSARDRSPSFTADTMNNFLLFDPKMMHPGQAVRPAQGPSSALPEYMDPLQKKSQEMIFTDSIVFTIGGGNYVEFESCLKAISKDQPHRKSLNLLYGTTEMTTAESFLSQLRHLSKKVEDETNQSE